MLLKLEMFPSHSLPEEDISAFFNLFAQPTDKLIITAGSKSIKGKVKRTKIDRDMTSILSSLFRKMAKDSVVDNYTYRIIVGDSSISSFYEEEEVYDLKLKLFKHIAYHFGYSECKCGGFTVKDKDNKKIQVEEVIYIKSDIKFISPSSLTFVKSETREKLDGCFNKDFKAGFITTSSILFSILSCREVHFKSKEDISYFLKRNDSFYVMYCEKDNPNLLSSTSISKEALLAGFLIEAPREISRYLYKLYIERDFSGLTGFIKFKKMMEKEVGFIWNFLCCVPLFLDNRDDITEKILETYEGLEHKKPVKKKGDYLEIKERRYIDSMKFNTLKRYFHMP